MEKRKTKLSVRDMAMIGVFAAVTAILSQVSIPLPSGVPVTLQTFAIALLAYSLGARKGAMAILVYLLLGAIGLPVFAGFHGGSAVLFGPTGGFLWGFIPMAYLCGLGYQRKPSQALTLGLLGLAVVHAFGVIAFALLTATPFGAAFMLVSLPFLIKDILSVILGYFLGKRLQTVMGQQGYQA